MKIIRALEYEAIPCFEILALMDSSDGRQLALGIEADTLASKYVQFEKQKIRGGGYRDCIVPTQIVGYVPLNRSVALWVEPKVPIANLDYIVKTYGGIVPDSFKCLRNYMQSDLDSNQLHDYIVRSFLTSVNELRGNGLICQYVRIEDDGGSLAGRIDFRRSANKFFSRGMSYRVLSSHFERTACVAPNICIKYALDYLAANSGTNASIKAELYDLITYFETNAGIKGVLRRPSFDVGKMHIPQSRRSYLDAIVLANTLTAEKSIDLETYTGEISTSNLAIDMSDTFENYMRAVLMRVDCDEWKALDGNHLLPPISLYESRAVADSYSDYITDASASNSGNDIDPDILIQRANGEYVVADVKYKPISGSLSANRQDAEQVVTYATRLGSSYALTIHPCKEEQESGLYYAGSIGSVNVFCYLFDLASQNMDDEERRLIDAIDLLAVNDHLIG